MKPKVCFVVQRYGLEVNGGAELHCRQLAEHLLPFCDVSVLTTKAIDYMTWKDEYSNNTDFINGIKILRFGVDKPRDIHQFNIVNQRFYDSKHMTSYEEQNWINEQGPLVPGLIRYLKQHKEDYDVFIFFTYLYYQTVMGVQEVKNKAKMCIRDRFKPLHFFRDEYTRAKEIFDKPTRILSSTGCFFMVRTDIFRKANGFDERFFMYFEDADLSRRIRKKASIVFYPNAYVYHAWKRDNTRSLKGIRIFLISMMKYFWKWK